MGMSASQARLLSITSRINDIEFKSQQISNVKIRLADESEQVANAYTRALNKQKLTITNYSASSAQKVDLTLAQLYKQGNLRLKSPDGRLVVHASSQYAKAYLEAMKSYNMNTTNSESDNRSNAANVYALMMKFDVASFNQACKDCNVTRDYDNHWKPLIDRGYITQEEVVSYRDEYFSLFELSSGNVGAGNKQQDGIIIVDDSRLNDANWLYEVIESGEFMLEQGSAAKGWEETSVSGNVSIAIESDSTGLAKAEAEYNAATAKINSKEKKLDNELKKLDTEHNALNTEFDSVKSLIGDNVEKSFNLFS